MSPLSLSLSLTLPLHPCKIWRNVCAAARQEKRFRKRWRNRENTRARIDRLPSGRSAERSVRQRDKHARGGGSDGSRDLCARPVKSVRAPAPGIFPDFQFICRHKARMPAAAVDNGRETRNDREMQALPIVIGPVPCCPSDTGGGARFLSNFKHP